MMSSKCKCFCPVSFGLALGLTGAVMMMLWYSWMMYQGVPAGMEGQMMMPDSWGAAFVHAFWVFVKGFVFGFIFAFFYNMIASRCMRMFCRSKGECCDASDSDKK